MTVREYLKDVDKYKDITFLRAISHKDSNTPFYHSEYYSTPIRKKYEWMRSDIMDYYVLNDKQPPIDWLTGGGWTNAYNNGSFLSLLVISKEDLELLYPDKDQTEDIIKRIENNLGK